MEKSRGVSVFALMAVSLQLICGVQAVCNVFDQATPVFSFDGFTQEDVDNVLKVIQPAFRTSGGTVRLVEQAGPGQFGGFAGVFWWEEQQRVADGFVVEFEMTMNGTGDGYAFIVQNDRTDNVLGGTGFNLGYRDALDSYIAVAFDACTDREQVPPTCSQETVEIVVQTAFPADPISIATANLSTSIKTGASERFQVAYTNENRNVIVFRWNGVNFDEILRGDIGVTAEQLWNSRYAWFGFTASTSWDLTATIELESLTLLQQPSDNVVAEAQTFPVITRYGELYELTVLIRDTCQRTVSTLPPSLQGPNLASKLRAFITSNSQGPASVNGTISPFYQGGGEVIVRFDMPALYNGTWDLYVEVDDIPAEGSPYLGAILSRPPPPPLIPVWLQYVLYVVSALALIAIGVAINKLLVYRKKLKDTEEERAEGKLEMRMRALDADIVYAPPNPLAGTIDHIEKLLEENQAELERLESGDTVDDQGYTIEKLQELNQKLRDELGELERKEQEIEQTEAAFAASKSDANKRVKHDFD